MSRTNKVNPGQYTIAGRLTPDDLGRELQKQQLPAPSPLRRRPRFDAPMGSPNPPAAVRRAGSASKPAPANAARGKAPKAVATKATVGKPASRKSAAARTAVAKRVVTKATPRTRGTLRQGSPASKRR